MQVYEIRYMRLKYVKSDRWDCQSLFWKHNIQNSKIYTSRWNQTLFQKLWCYDNIMSKYVKSEIWDCQSLFWKDTIQNSEIYTSRWNQMLFQKLWCYDNNNYVQVCEIRYEIVNLCSENTTYKTVKSVQVGETRHCSKNSDVIYDNNMCKYVKSDMRLSISIWNDNIQNKWSQMLFQKLLCYDNIYVQVCEIRCETVITSGFFLNSPTPAQNPFFI